MDLYSVTVNMPDHPMEVANVYLQVHTSRNHRDFKSQVSLNLSVLCVHMMLILKYVYNVYLCP